MVAVEELENQILNTTKNLRKTKAQPSGDAICNNISSTKKKSIKYHKELNKLINAKFWQLNFIIEFKKFLLYWK